MQIIVLPSGRSAALATAQFLARLLRAQPASVLGLPTGRTMIPVYQALVSLHGRGRVDFAKATTFNLDEFVGGGSAEEGSYRAFMRRYLFDAVNVSRRRTHFPGEQDSRSGTYDDMISAAGGLDLCLVGIGMNGHLGFNEPGSTLTPGTHRVRLMPATRRANAYLFDGRIRDVPRVAHSMGIATILGARTIVLLATGAAKASIVRRAVAGPVTTRVPASLIQTHPNALVVLDRAAARELGRHSARDGGLKRR
jgi:glucosamine-6-phosphate deaminase